MKKKLLQDLLETNFHTVFEVLKKFEILEKFEVFKKFEVLKK